jgi:hypothetical protein
LVQRSVTASGVLGRITIGKNNRNPRIMRHIPPRIHVVFGDGLSRGNRAGRPGVMP